MKSVHRKALTGIHRRGHKRLVGGNSFWIRQSGSLLMFLKASTTFGDIYQHEVVATAAVDILTHPCLIDLFISAIEALPIQFKHQRHSPCKENLFGFSEVENLI